MTEGSGYGSGFLSGFGSGPEKVMDPNPVCPERLDPDPVNINWIRNPAYSFTISHILPYMLVHPVTHAAKLNTTMSPGLFLFSSGDRVRPPSP